MPLTFVKLRTVFAVVLCVLALGSAVCLSTAVLSDYDASLHHFSADSAAAAAAAVIVLMSAVVSLSLGLFTKAKKIPAVPTASLPAVFAAALLGFLLIASFIFDIPSAENWFQRIRLAAMALSACYFLLTTQKTASESPACALLSLAPIVYAFLSVLHAYFDTSMAMNSPLKSWYLMTYLAMALFFTAEARVTLQRPKPPTYCLFTGLCLVLAGAVGISHTLLALSGAVYFLTLRDAVAVTAAAIYAAARLFSLRETAEEKAPAEEGTPAQPDPAEEEVLP